MKLLLLSIVIFLLGLANLLEPMRSGFQYIFGPLQFGLVEVAGDIEGSFEFFTNLRQIRNENLSLMEENNNLKARIVELKELQEENETLRAQLELKTTGDFEKELVMVSVLGNPSDASGNTVVINNGTRAGIQVGDTVVRGKYLVGSVVSTTAFRSVVELISSPALSATAYDIETGTEGLVTGQYGTNLVMERILPGEVVNAGDFIVTSGKDGQFEPGLIVGTISNVAELTADPLIRADIEQVIDIKKLDKVFVIIRQ